MRLVHVNPGPSSDRRHCGLGCIHVPLRRTRLQPKTTASNAGYTMVELMVVVIIIAVVAAMAIPNVTRRMQERRASEAAQRVALMYQTARARAMGRGTAVLVRFTKPTQQGALEMREAQRGPGVGAGCETLPVSSCTDTDWDIAARQQFRSVTKLDLGRRAEYDKVQISMITDGVSRSFVDVCFTPMGRTFVRTATGLEFSTMNGVFEAQVTRANTASRTRSVMILPNGAARLQ
ncbi:MAG TPA: prepilin-type N-terminal cleavage/methylation domain-containing protein [Polyangiaceae bacterium]|nr:prepilin-type N-terminal cleavage/methylation domain-containing protein [Polyangiaceae bacterium]